MSTDTNWLLRGRLRAILGATVTLGVAAHGPAAVAADAHRG